MQTMIVLKERAKWALEINLPDCLNWHKSLVKGGYGQIGRKLPNVHRVAWEYLFGKIPDGLYVLHKCDNPKCYNPHHLFLGTQKDNIKDMMVKGRHATSTTRMSLEEAAKIRETYFNSDITLSELGVQFNISTTQVHRIVSNPDWGKV